MCRWDLCNQKLHTTFWHATGRRVAKPQEIVWSAICTQRSDVLDSFRRKAINLRISARPITMLATQNDSAVEYASGSIKIIQFLAFVLSGM